MDKIYILGLDGLEFNFVEAWNLKNIKQNEYSKIQVPITEEQNIPMSPEVWGSFLTGKIVSQSFSAISPPLKRISDFLSFTKKYTIGYEKLVNFLQKLIPDSLWKKRVTGYSPLENKTFLDITNSKPINVLYYNEDPIIHLIFYYFSIGKISLKKTVQLFMALYKKYEKQIFNETKRFQDSYDLIFSYLHFPDILQHVLMFRPYEIKNHYLEIENFVSSLKNIIPESTLFLIISDHGFDLKRGTHSNHGFYSSNMPLNPKPKHITDFYNIIIHLSNYKE